MSQLLEIINVKYLHDKVLHIKFSNDEEADVDLSPMLEDKRGIFTPLQDNQFFQSFKVDYTLCWDGDTYNMLGIRLQLHRLHHDCYK